MVLISGIFSSIVGVLAPGKVNDWTTFGICLGLTVALAVILAVAFSMAIVNMIMISAEEILRAGVDLIRAAITSYDL